MAGPSQNFWTTFQASAVRMHRRSRAGPFQPSRYTQMKLLLDECLPRKLKFFFSERGHHCTTVREAGFGSKENGELLALAESNYDVLVTIDKNIRHQQNMTGRHIAILIIRAPSND